MTTTRWYQSSLTWLLSLGFLLAIGSWFWSRKRTSEREQARYYAEIMKLPDTLRVVTLSGATTYFHYRDEEMGYQYELAKLMADSLGLPMTLHVAANLQEIHLLIDSGQMDLSITPEAVSRTGKTRFRYTGLEEHSGMVLVQQDQSRYSAPDSYVSDVTQLLGKRIYVPADSRYAQRLRHLEEQLGGHIDIVPLTGDTITSEGLMAQVASHQIDYTVVDQELAVLIRRYYPGIDVGLEVGFPRRLRWITSPRREGLALAIDRWAQSVPNIDAYRLLYRRYFDQGQEHIRHTSPNRLGEMQYVYKGQISPYDSLFRTEAVRLGWDWQLLASIAFQESNFLAHIIGWSGARGLMGIMPRTGQSFGANKQELLDPGVSVRVAVDCLLATERYFSSVKDPVERRKFTLAGYNAGVAHIQDAQRLAGKYGADSNKWSGHVAEYILLKSDPKYYTDPVCRYGYLRGRETYQYVTEVMDRYQFYLDRTSQTK